MTAYPDRLTRTARPRIVAQDFVSVEGLVEPGGRPLAASLASVCLDIRGTRILSEVSWDVGRGEKWVVLGLNGSGKTSLLRLLSGFGYPSRGTMEVLGEHFGKAD